MRRLAVSMLLALPACAATPPAAVEITDLAIEQIPEDVMASVRDASRDLPGFSISEAQKKVRDGRTYYDIEGVSADGREIEFDILIGSNGPEIVEIQRDLNWADVPGPVSQALPGIEPARVIESLQTDGTIIYELFAPGHPADPEIEIALDTNGAVSILDERWPH